MKVLSIEAVYEDERKAPNHREAATLSMEEEIWQRRREKISTVILKKRLHQPFLSQHIKE